MARGYTCAARRAARGLWNGRPTPHHGRAIANGLYHRRIDVGHREQTLSALLERLTPLDPRRPAHDLLEHLLSGVRACLLVYREEAIDASAAPPDRAEDDGDDHNEFDGMSAAVVAAFTAAVRDRAERDRDRLNQ